MLNKSGLEGYVAGYPDDTIRAENFITRYETAFMIYRLILDENKAAYVQEVNKFSDVEDDKWFSAV